MIENIGDVFHKVIRLVEVVHAQAAAIAPLSIPIYFSVIRIISHPPSQTSPHRATQHAST